MSRIRFTDPVFKDALDSVPTAVRREVSLSFDIADRIDQVLKQKGWSQADLAKATGKKAPVVTRWVSGSHNFTIRTISEIESALGEDILLIKREKRQSSKSSPKPYQLSRPTPLFLNEDSESDNNVF